MLLLVVAATVAETTERALIAPPIINLLKIYSDKQISFYEKLLTASRTLVTPHTSCMQSSRRDCTSDIKASSYGRDHQLAFWQPNLFEFNDSRDCLG